MFEIQEDPTNQPEEAAPLPRKAVWKVSASVDEVKEKPELHRQFCRPYISRTGLIMPNMVVAEFDEDKLEEARTLYYDLLINKMWARCNWFNQGKKK